jgi:hypothetical protein
MRPIWFEILIEREPPKPDYLLMGYATVELGVVNKVWACHVYDDRTVDLPGGIAKALADHHLAGILADAAERKGQRCE